MFCVCRVYWSALLSAPFSAAASPAPSEVPFFPAQSYWPPAASSTRPAPCRHPQRGLKRCTSLHMKLCCSNTHKLMSRSSSCSACSSSDSSSPLAEDREEEEVCECLRLPVSWPFALLESTRLLQSCGWCRFRRDKTDWTFARTEWLQVTDWESVDTGSKRAKTEDSNTKCTGICLYYRSSNKRHISQAQSIMWLCIGWPLCWRLLEREIQQKQLIHGKLQIWEYEVHWK